MRRVLAPMLRRLFMPTGASETMDIQEPAAPGEPGVTIIGALHASVAEHERVTSAEASAYERRLRETMAAIDDVFHQLGARGHG